MRVDPVLRINVYRVILVSHEHADGHCMPIAQGIASLRFLVRIVCVCVCDACRIVSSAVERNFGQFICCLIDASLHGALGLRCRMPLVGDPEL